jgi:hypothetical protein
MWCGGSFEFLLHVIASYAMLCRMTKPARTTVSIQSATLARVREMQQEMETLTGIRPTASSIIERCVRDGVETLRRRPALAVDTTPRKGDR